MLITVRLDKQPGRGEGFMLKKEQKYAADITQAVLSLFDEENEENFKYDVSEIDLTAFFTGFTMAFNVIYKNVTQRESDLVECIAIQNRLLVQYLLANGQTKSETDTE